MSQLPEAAADVRSTAAFWSYYTTKKRARRMVILIWQPPDCRCSLLPVLSPVPLRRLVLGKPRDSLEVLLPWHLRCIFRKKEKCGTKKYGSWMTSFTWNIYEELGIFPVGKGKKMCYTNEMNAWPCWKQQAIFYIDYRKGSHHGTCDCDCQPEGRRG